MTTKKKDILKEEAAKWAQQAPGDGSWQPAPNAVPRDNESLMISVRFPKRLVTILKEFARREGIGYQVLFKRWLDDRVRYEARRFLQSEVAMPEKDVHTEHCCFRHGFCKYGNSLCPVTSGAKKQNRPCEQCMDEAVKQEPWKSRLQALDEATFTLSKVACRKCGITDELCLCAAKAYIRELEAKIEKLEDDDDKPPTATAQDDLCMCRHMRRAHNRGTEDNSFDAKCRVDGCGCVAFQRIDDEAAWKSIRQFLGDAAAQHQDPERLAFRIIDMAKFYSAKCDEYFETARKLKAKYEKANG